MKKFWEHVITNPEDFGKKQGEIAFILPKDYGWGMRNPDDNIWLPKWGSDDLSPIIWENLNRLIDDYGLYLDIIYDDPRFVIENYSRIFYWDNKIK